MATKKITELTELAAVPADTDVLEIVDDPAGTPISKKIQYTNLVPDASTTVKGKVELATVAEIDTGTDTGRVPSVDTLNGSIHGIKYVQLHVVDDATALTTGDGKMRFFIPPQLNGMDLVDADACVVTASSSGTPTVMVHNVTGAADMLSTAITIDASEKTSYTAATAPVIDTANDDVATGDEIRIDIDGIGTGTAGLYVNLGFRLP